MAAPLFLLAPPRSYTSLINAMLGQHPQAFGLPELCLFNVEVLKAGIGASPTIADVAMINYKGMLPDGKVFDEGKQAVLPLEGVIPGFTKALEQMQRGGKYKVFIPAKLAYGDRQAGEIPPNTDLTFEIELIDFKSRAEIEQQQRMMQQLQEMQAQQEQQKGKGQGAPKPE